MQLMHVYSSTNKMISKKCMCMSISFDTRVSKLGQLFMVKLAV